MTSTNLLGIVQSKITDPLVIGKIYEKKGNQYYIKDKKNRTHVVSSFSTYSIGTTVITRKGFILNTVSDYESIQTFVV